MGGSATGDIERAGDRDWFAVTLEVGKEYRIDLEGSPTDAGTLRNPYLRGVLRRGRQPSIRGTTDNNGGVGHNGRLFFEAENAGTYYIAAGANGRPDRDLRALGRRSALDLLRGPDLDR